MPYTTNPFDGIRIYFEDDGGKGDAALFYGGILDSVDLVRVSDLATGLKESADEFRPSSSICGVRIPAANS